MTLSRRTLVLTTPALATGLLAGCQGDDATDPSTATAGARERPQALPGVTAVGGQLYVTASSADFPSLIQPLRPEAQRVQACLNGLSLHIDLSHTASGGQQRSMALTLTNASAWVDGQTVEFIGFDPANAAGKTPPPNHVTGLIAHLPPIRSTLQATDRYVHRVTGGTLRATLQGSLLTLEFSTSLAKALVAQPLPSHSSNRARGNLQLMSTTARPSWLALRWVQEDTASI